MNVRTRHLESDGSASVVELTIDEPFYRLVADSIPHIVFVTRPDGSTEYFNRQGTEYTGQAAHANYGWDWVSLIHPDQSAGALSAWESCVRAGTPYRLDYRIRGLDGRYRWH